MGAIAWLAVAAVTAGPTAAMDPARSAPLAPATRWAIDYGVDECRLIRSFGPDGARATLRFSLSQPDLDIAPDLSLAWPGLAASHAFVRRKATIWTDGAADPQPVDVAILRQGTGAAPILYADGAGALAEKIAADGVARRDTVMTVRVGGQSLRIDAGRLQAPLQALRRCMDDQLRGWGYDPVVQHGLSKKPVPLTSPTIRFTAADFPAEQLRAGEGAIVNVRIDVAADGAIAGCHVTRAGGPVPFQDTTCRLIRERGRFAPAIDAAGKAVPSPYFQRIRWLPAGNGPTFWEKIG